MSRQRTEEVRDSLLEAGARLLASEGRGALTTRRLAAELGASTMAVYTHFGSMEQLRQAIREEGFARLGAHLQSVPRTSDPVADLSALGWAYCFNALANPHMYRAMFLEEHTETELARGRASFEQIIEAVDRCIDAGRFITPKAQPPAIQLWTAGHGMICAVLARVLTIEQVTEQFSAIARSLYIGFGDQPVRARRSIASAQRRMQAQ